MSYKIGIADTTFARADMAKIAEKTLKDHLEGVKVFRYTVPGVKDLPLACKMLIDDGCSIVMALGMPGDKPIDKVCAHEASQGMIQAQLMTGRHIVEVFVYLDEGKSEKELLGIVKERTRKHALNVISLLRGRNTLQRFVGTGKRQGTKDVGELLN